MDFDLRRSLEELGDVSAFLPPTATYVVGRIQLIVSEIPRKQQVSSS